MEDFAIFSSFASIESYHSSQRGFLTTSPMLSGVGGFLVRLITLFRIALIYLIWLKMDMFSWIFVIKISLSLCAVITWTILHMSVRCWPDMVSMTCNTIVGYFLTMLIIHSLVIFIEDTARFHGVLFVDWKT